MFKGSLKRYLISSGISFLTGFLPVILSSLDTLTMETIKDGALIGIFIAAIRAGLKTLFEYVIPVIKEWLSRNSAKKVG